MKNPMARVYNQSHAKANLTYYLFFSDDFGLRSPVVQKTFLFKAKTATTSIVARVYTIGSVTTVLQQYYNSITTVLQQYCNSIITVL